MTENKRNRPGIQSVRAKRSATTTSDSRTRVEEQDLDRRRKELENESLLQNIKARREYANRIFVLVCIWLSAALAIVTLSGFGAHKNWFELADSTLIALITSSTASVIGLFTIVASYLFRSDK